MALIKCEECGQVVSDKAEACPHCGCPVEKLMACPECGNIIEGGGLIVRIAVTRSPLERLNKLQTSLIKI